MPNWIHNEIIIKGEEKDITKIYNKHFKEGFDFNSVVKMPKVIFETDSNGSNDISAYLTINKIPMRVHTRVQLKSLYYGWRTNANTEICNLKHGEQEWNNFKKYKATNWYNWSVKNWGTKWNACEVDVCTDGTTILATFNTAWSEPTLIFNKLKEKYPMVSISTRSFPM